MNLHPYHVLMMAVEPFGDRMKLDNLFRGMDSIDTLERQWMIGLTASAIGAEWDHDKSTEEESADAMYAAFKEQCWRLVDCGIQDFTLAHMLVLYLLNVLRLQGDEEYARSQTNWLKNAIKFFQKRADDGETDSDTADSCSRMAEEAMNNKMANAELDRERYIMFCEKVVVHFLPPLPPELSRQV